MQQAEQDLEAGRLRGQNRHLTGSVECLAQERKQCPVGEPLCYHRGAVWLSPVFNNKPKDGASTEERQDNCKAVLKARQKPGERHCHLGALATSHLAGADCFFPSSTRPIFHSKLFVAPRMSFYTFYSGHMHRQN